MNKWTEITLLLVLFMGAPVIAGKWTRDFDIQPWIGNAATFIVGMCIGVALFKAFIRKEE